MIRISLIISITLVISISNAQTNTDLVNRATESQDILEAKALLTQARSAYLRDDDFKPFLNTSVLLADIYIDEYSFDSCIMVLVQPLSREYNNEDQDSILAQAYHINGIAHFNLVENKIAIENWKKSISVRKKIPNYDTLLLVKSYRNIGAAYQELNSLKEAEKYIHLSYKTNNSLETPDEIKDAQLNGDLGKLYTDLEDYDRAKRHLDITETLYEKIFAEEPWEINLIYEYQYGFNLALESTEEMKKYAKKSMNLFANIEEKYPEDYMAEARAYNNLAIAFEKQQDYNSSILAYKKGIDIFENHIDEEWIFTQLSISYSNMSEAQARVSQYDSALHSISKAINISKEINDKDLLSSALENKATILMMQGQYYEALNIVNEALQLMSHEELNSQKSSNIFNKSLYLTYVNTKIEILKKLYDQTSETQYLNTSAKIVEDGISILDQIRSGYISDESKAFLSKEAKELIAQGISTYYQLYEIAPSETLVLKAWELSEKSKSIILLESLRASQAKKKTNVGDDLIIKEDSIKKEIATIEKEIQLDETNSLELNKIYLQLNTELKNVAEQIKKENPKYAAAALQMNDTPLIESLNKSEKDVIEYFINENLAFAFLKNEDLYAMHKLNNASDIKPLIETVRKTTIDIFSQSLDKDPKYKYTVAQYDSSAYQLYNNLIGSIKNNTLLSEDLLIIPDGVLGYLPFDLLLTSLPESADFNSKSYLINDHNISYTYSIALLEEMKNFNHRRSDNAILSIAPLFENNDEVYAYGNRKIKKEKQPPLYFNVPEIEAIHAIMGGDMISGIDATEASFLNKAPDYNILHLSTHGKANDEKGSFSYLAFTEIVDSTENEFVYNYDLYNMDLNADMVVLSACETGLGELKAGEGIISLARGFSYAGAKSIINTLWTINDYRTKEIMESFYTGIADGQNKDIALRAAKLKFIKDNPNEALPFYWAAFIPVGDMSAIENNSLPKNFIYYIMALCGLILVVLFLKKKSNRA